MKVSDLKKDEIVIEWFKQVRARPNTVKNYLVALQFYTDFTKMNPYELIEEAENEIDEGIRPRKQKIKQYVMDFQEYLESKELAPYTINSRMNAVKSFYKYNEDSGYNELGYGYDQTPKGYSPKVEGYKPKGSGYQPKSGEYKPTSEEYKPKSGNYSPKAGEYSPKSGGYSGTVAALKRQEALSTQLKKKPQDKYEEAKKQLSQQVKLSRVIQNSLLSAKTFF
jgi:hypothetical protein